MSICCCFKYHSMASADGERQHKQIKMSLNYNRENANSEEMKMCSEKIRIFLGWIKMNELRFTFNDCSKFLLLLYHKIHSFFDRLLALCVLLCFIHFSFMRLSLIHFIFLS